MPPFAPEERLTKYKDRVNRYWKKMMSQKHPDAMAHIQEEMHADAARLFIVCGERADGAELADLIVRYYENVTAFAHYTGIRRGYNIGIEVGRDERLEAITKLISKRLEATPNEICELIDTYNSKFVDLHDKRRIYLKWPELRKKDARWADVEHIPKVKNYLVRIRKKAKRISAILSWQHLMKEHKAHRKPTRKEPPARQSNKPLSENRKR